MQYYKTNAIYDYLQSRKLKQFKFVSGNAWQLVYGDSKGKPLMLVYVVGVASNVIKVDPESSELEGYNLLKKIGDISNLPLVYIRFISDLEVIETVNILDNGSFKEITLQKLSEYYRNEGLPITNTSTAKYLNDRSSSAYHNWQRTSLGRDLSVSDIDLWKINSNDEPELIIELKRSFIDLDRWAPYRDDYKNFILISNVCNMANIKFKIVYNQRIKEPFQDKIDRLKVFSVDFSKTPPISSDGIINISEFESI